MLEIAESGLRVLVKTLGMTLVLDVSRFPLFAAFAICASSLARH